MRTSRMMWVMAWLTVGVTLGMAGIPRVVQAQGAGDAAQSESTQAKAEFERVFSQWKELLKQLRDLQVKFSISEPDGLEPIRAEYLATVQQASALIPQLRDAALAVYRSSPNEDLELTRFLLTLAQDDLANDRYEAVAQTTEALIAGQCDSRDVYDWAGTAAFATHDFDRAQQYLEKADELSSLEKGERYLPLVAEVRAAWQQEQEIRKREAEADDLPRVRLQTSKGEIVLELFENEAPGTVGNFIHLVEKGFYDGLSFHRVLPGFMAQGGCPRGDGTGDPGYKIYCEAYEENHRNHFRGSLSMAKGTQRNTGGSQFFLTFLPTPHLNGVHTVFGRVIDGLEVLAKLERSEQAASAAAEPDRILKAEVIRKRDHPYLPRKVE